MHLLILGYSSIVRRRVLPAATSVAAIGRISIASRTGASADFRDYDEALASSGADAVYVSGPNAFHQECAMRALERGMHVIVDKPAFPDSASAQAAAAQARARRRALAEATVFSWHPQFDAVRSLIAQEDAAQTRVMATFCIPPLPPGDFRYRADCGGGSLYDQGPYVAAVNRLIFGKAPDAVACRVLSTADVDTSFGFLLTHGHGGALAGHCGFTTAYQNRLSIVTRSKTLQVDRIFSPPPDYTGSVTVRDDSGETAVAVPAADTFALFLQAFADAVARNDYEPFEAALLQDAALLERLRETAAR